jgi:hypothetical protein
MFRVHQKEASGAVRERLIAPRDDEETLQLYRRITKDFPLISKMYPDTILSTVLHRSIPRDFLIAEAQKYFEEIRIVWVKSDDKDTAQRIQKGKHAPGRLETLLARKKRQAEEFQEFGTTIPTIVYSLEISDAVEQFRAAAGVSRLK